MTRSIVRSRVRARWWVCVALLAWSGARDVQAQASRPALHWSRAENAPDCVDPKTLAELVETYTGPVLVAPASADASIEGAIERASPEAFSLRVSITVSRGRPAGQRVLSLPAADCRKLDGAIAFVIASTLDPDLGENSLPAELSWLRSETPAADELRGELATTPPPAAAPPTASRANAQPTAAAAAADPAPAQIEDPAAESPSAGRWELGIAVVAGRGRVPTPAVGGLLSVAHAFSSAFAVTLHLRGNADVGGFDVEAGRSASVNTFDSALLACLRTGSDRALGFQGCLGPTVGFFSTHGEGFDAAHTVVQPLYGGQLELEAAFAIADKLSLTAAGLLDVGWRRPIVEYEILRDRHLLFRSKLYAIQGAIGLTRSF